MLKNWITRLPMFAVAHQAPDAAGGGGSADPNGSGDDSTSSDDSAGQDESDGDAGAGDEPATQATETIDPEQELERILEDDDEPNDQRPVEERFAAVLSTNKRLKREMRKLQPVKQQLRDAGVKNVGEMLQKARTFDQLQDLAKSDPAKLRRILFDDDTPAPTSARTGNGHTAASESDDLIPLDKLPFDVNNGDPINQFMRDLVQKVNEQHRELKGIKGEHQTSRQREQQRGAQAFRQHWDSAVDAAAKQIPDDNVRILFKDALVMAREIPDVRKRGVSFLVNHYLTKFKVSTTTRARVNDALRQTTAKNNTQLPRQHTGGGMAATAKGDYKPTFASIREKLDAAED
jgi:nitrogen fixation-related uncharacterized protein